MYRYEATFKLNDGRTVHFRFAILSHDLNQATSEALAVVIRDYGPGSIDATDWEVKEYTGR